MAAAPKDSKKGDDPSIDCPPVSYLQLFRFTSTADRWSLLLAAIATLFSSACFPFMNILFGEMSQLLIDLQNEHEHQGFGGHGQGLQNETFFKPANSTESQAKELLRQLARLALYLALVGVVQLVCGFLFVFLFNRVAAIMIRRLQKLYFRAVLRQNVGWHDTIQQRNFTARISEDMVKMQEATSEKAGLFLFYLLNTLIYLIIAFVYGWWLTLIVLGAAAPLITIASYIMSLLQAKFTAQAEKAYDKAGAGAMEALSNIKTVLAYQGQQTEIKRYGDDLKFSLAAGKRRGIVSAVGYGILRVLQYLTYALAFWYGSKLIFDERREKSEATRYRLADLLIVIFNVLGASFNIGMCASFLEIFGMGRKAAANIYAVIDRVPEIDSSSKSGASLADNFSGQIEFSNVQFAFPSRPKLNVLKELNLKIEGGKTIALVGNSGNGKSTILQLIQRFYDPAHGSVKLDGVNIRKLNLTWLRSQIGIVCQEPILFNTTILENIKFGRLDASQADVEEACRIANALTFISKLPKKFDTIIGNGGSQLSGGQKQRIAIARALVKKPKILLLDEATSALDTQSERVVQKALESARQGRTTIIVAHRLSTIRSADVIVAIENGQVVEIGSHKELMKKQGLYFDLVTAQLTHPEADDPLSSDEGQGHSQVTDQTQVENLLASSVSKLTLDHNKNCFKPDEEEITKNGSNIQKLAPVALYRQLLTLNKTEWPSITGGVFMSILAGCIHPLYAYFFGSFLGIFSAHNDHVEGQQQADIFALIFMGIGLFAGISVAGSLATFSLAGEALTNRLRLAAFSAMMKQPLAWFDQLENNTGALCTRLSVDTASVQGATGCRLGVVFQALTTIVVSTVMAVWFMPKVAIVALAFVPLIILAIYYSGKMMEEQQIEEKKATEKSLKFVFEAVANIRTVASLGREEQFVTMYSQELQKSHKEALRLSPILGLAFGLSQSLMYFAYAAVIYYGGTLVNDEGTDYTNIFIIGEALIWSMVMLGETLVFAPNFSKAKVAALRIFELLDSVHGHENEDELGVSLKNPEGHVTFNEVEFNYPTRPTSKILKGLSLDVRPKVKLGICGPSGSGKSTVVKLILRFYDPVKGQVCIDHVDVSKVSVTSLRSHISVVEQEPALFDRTLAENIGYGDLCGQIPMTEVIQAATWANIHSFISSLPAGYETKVGQMGSQISGGQKQRIAIARALIKNPRILLLDEGQGQKLCKTILATSALDAESEKIVQAAVDKVSEGRTLISIAHRLSSIQSCDQIVVLKDGAICESGVHAELLRRRGVYHSLWHSLDHNQHQNRNLRPASLNKKLSH